MKLYYAIIFSIIAHLLIYEVMEKYASHIETAKGNENIEVILLDDGKERQIVLNPKTPPPDSLEPSDTPYLSEKNQQFRQQQRAAEIGKTVNRSPEPNENRRQRREQDQQEQDLVKKLKEISQLSDEILKQIERNKSGVLPGQYGFDPSPLPSTVNDPFTNLPIGSFTALNTNRYLYYSYFERIDNQVRGRWINHVRRTIDFHPKVPAGEKKREVWTTELEILLDEKGQFVKADVVTESGIAGFDLAAIDAFREGAPIPNPPQGIVEVDGYIHLRYAFNVHWRPFYY